MSIEECALCGGRQSREVFRSLRPAPASATGRHTEALFGRAGTLVRCTTCGLVRQIDPPNAPYEEMDDAEYLSEEAGIRRTFAAALEEIERHRAPPGRLFDVGCGPGFMLDEARKRGWYVAGVEPSAWGAEHARALGIDVANGTLEDTSATEGFDVVVAADVIEHVGDPVLFMSRIRDLLVPGGVAYITTPNVASVVARLLRRWWWSVIPNHLWFFSPKTLEHVMQKAGFAVVWSATHPKTFSVEYYAGRFAGYNKWLGTFARQATRLVGSRRLVTPNFRDRIAMIATPVVTKPGDRSRAAD